MHVWSYAVWGATPKRALFAVALVIAVGSVTNVQASSVPFDTMQSSQYLIIARESINCNTAVATHNFELGANKAPVPATNVFLDGGSTGGPTLLGNVPNLPANAFPVFQGIGGGGNIAVMNQTGEFALQNVGVYADPSVGIRVSTLSESRNTSSNAFFNDPNMYPNTFDIGTQTGWSVDAVDQGDGSPFADPFTRIDSSGGGYPSSNVGVTYGFDHSSLLSELDAAMTSIGGSPGTGVLDVSTGVPGELDLASTVTDGTLTFASPNSLGGVDATLTLGSGLHVIDIDTANSPGHDFLLNKANFVIDGPADAFVIFRLLDDDNMLIADSNVLIGNSGIGLNNVMFYTGQAENDTHFDFENTVLNGIAFWSLGPNGGSIDINGAQGSGQFVANIVDMNDVRFNRSSFVPEPTTLYLLVLGSLALLRRRR